MNASEALGVTFGTSVYLNKLFRKVFVRNISAHVQLNRRWYRDYSFYFFYLFTYLYLVRRW